MARKGEVNHYATGLTLITVGVFGIVGALTGNLADMLAALFAPDTLSGPGGDAASKNPTSLTTGIGNVLLDPGYGLKQFGKVFGFNWP